MLKLAVSAQLMPITQYSSPCRSLNDTVTIHQFLYLSHTVHFKSQRIEPKQKHLRRLCMCAGARQASDTVSQISLLTYLWHEETAETMGTPNKSEGNP